MRFTIPSLPRGLVQVNNGMFVVPLYSTVMRRWTYPAKELRRMDLSSRNQERQCARDGTGKCWRRVLEQLFNTIGPRVKQAGERDGCSGPSLEIEES